MGGEVAITVGRTVTVVVTPTGEAGWDVTSGAGVTATGGDEDAQPAVRSNPARASTSIAMTISRDRFFIPSTAQPPIKRIRG
jgi:hypothetical protein